MLRCFVAISFALGVTSPARADATERGTAGAPSAGRDQAFDVEGPPPSPGLSHRGVAIDFEYTIATAQPTDVTSYEPIAGARAYAYAASLTAETAVVPRTWFLGLANQIGAASVPAGVTPGSGGSAVVVGNPEVWARGLWSSRVGLSAGGGLGLVLPLPRKFPAIEGEVVRAIRVVRPWDDPHFQDLTITARPFFDIRHVVGPVVFQLRQGVDIALRLRGPVAPENRFDYAALASFYVGVHVGSGQLRRGGWGAKPVTLGIELHEVYQLTADVASPSCLAPCDQHRVQFTLAPSIRLAWKRVTPTLSVLLPLSTPLRAEVASYYAARVHLGARIELP